MGLQVWLMTSKHTEPDLHTQKIKWKEDSSCYSEDLTPKTH